MVTFENVYQVFGQDQVDQLAFEYGYDVVSAGLLVAGDRYLILEATGTTDFTMVGASSNDVGTSFRATSSLIIPDWNGGELQRGYSKQEIIEIQIAEARDKLKAEANKAGHEYDESQDYQQNFIVYYTMYLLYMRNNNEKQGYHERKEAMLQLHRYWGNTIFDGENLENQDTKPMNTATAKVTTPTWEDEDDLSRFLE